MYASSSPIDKITSTMGNEVWKPMFRKRVRIGIPSTTNKPMAFKVVKSIIIKSKKLVLRVHMIKGYCKEGAWLEEIPSNVDLKKNQRKFWFLRNMSNKVKENFSFMGIIIMTLSISLVAPVNSSHNFPWNSISWPL